MRALQVVPALAARTGGVATSVVESCLALEACGVEAPIFTTDLAAAASAKGHRPVRVDELPAGASELDIQLFRSRPPRRLAFSPALLRALAAEARRCDVIHLHSLFLFPQWAGYRAALGAQVPYVVSPRGALDPFLRTRGRRRKAIVDGLWQRRMFERAGAIVFTAAQEADLASDVLPAEASRFVVPNPIDLRVFDVRRDGGRFRRRFLNGRVGPLVMNLGRISHKKGLDVLIRAFAVVNRQTPESLLAIVGPDDEGLQPKLETLAGAMGIADSVVFTGMLHGEEKLEALAAATVWALPSYTENFGVAVIEALAAGVPTVISPHVNIAPAAEAAGAVVVAPVHADAVAASLTALLADECERRQLAGRGHAFASRFARPAVGALLAETYTRVSRGSARSLSPELSGA
jgi:glycosyltransferase involved in cell wall biosynthesis